MEQEIRDLLEQASDPQLAERILTTYKNTERQFYTQDWKACQPEAGQFVEAVRRFLELKLGLKSQCPEGYTPIGDRLPNFNESVLKQYENKQEGDVAYRTLIPRLLFTIYTLRNKRGGGHLPAVDPGHQDATVILHIVKWVLAELIGLNSTYGQADTLRLVNHVRERPVELFWKSSRTGVVRLEVDEPDIGHCILLLLFGGGLNTGEDLLRSIQITNTSALQARLKLLHKDGCIEYQSFFVPIELRQKGMSLAEELMLKHSANL